MIATLLTTLFVASAFLALGAIADSWHSFGAAALALRGQLRATCEVREYRFTLVTTEVRDRRADMPRYRITPLAGPALFQPARRAA